MTASRTSPRGWGDDKLSTFMDAGLNNIYASFTKLREELRLLSDVNDAFYRVAEHLTHPPDWFVALFLLRAHSSYLGGAQLALAGQLPEAYTLLRGCLENALYAFPSIRSLPATSDGCGGTTVRKAKGWSRRSSPSGACCGVYERPTKNSRQSPRGCTSTRSTLERTQMSGGSLRSSS